MHRSSECIGTIAAALAKAQAELPMPGAMRCSRWSALLGRMILTRRTSMQHPKPALRSHPDPIIRAHQPSIQNLRHGLAMAQSSVCVLVEPLSHPINRHFFGTACSLKWSPSTQPMRRPSGRVRIFPPRTRLQRGMLALSKRNFRRVSTVGDGEGPSEPSNTVLVRNVMPASRPDGGDSQKTSKTSGKPPRNSAVRALGKTVRLRDKEHRKFVSRQACLVCGRTPSDPHHLTFMQPRALGHRGSDEFTVPVCRVHHRELHRQGDEAAWWDKLSIDPLPVALKLWQHTRVYGTAIPMSGGAELGSANATNAC
jgi:hypothetical protein